MDDILERINHGYGRIAPVVLGLMASGKCFMLVGRHGTGKSRLARVLSRGNGEGGCVFYDATKDDMISVAGIPDPAALRRGRLRFVPHQRTIWDKSTVVVDELSRASGESQNLWLEILEERTCFGQPLVYRTLVATANPESYAAAFRMDEALVDRFHAVVPVPDLQEGIRREDVAAVIERSLGRGHPPDGPELAALFERIRSSAREMERDGSLERITSYVARVVEALLPSARADAPATGRSAHISPRTYGRNLPECIVAIGAYHRVAGAEAPLVRAAREALTYCIGTKLGIREELLGQLHDACKELLLSGSGAGVDGRLDLVALESLDDRLRYLRERGAAGAAALSPDELERILGPVVAEASLRGCQRRLLEARDLMGDLGYRGDAARQVESRLALALSQALGSMLAGVEELRGEANRDEGLAGAERVLKDLGRRGALSASADPGFRHLVERVLALHDRGAPFARADLAALATDRPAGEAP